MTVTFVVWFGSIVYTGCTHGYEYSKRYAHYNELARGSESAEQAVAYLEILKSNILEDGYGLEGQYAAVWFPSPGNDLANLVKIIDSNILRGKQLADLVDNPNATGNVNYQETYKSYRHNLHHMDMGDIGFYIMRQEMPAFQLYLMLGGFIPVFLFVPMFWADCESCYGSY